MDDRWTLIPPPRRDTSVPKTPPFEPRNFDRNYYDKFLFDYSKNTTDINFSKFRYALSRLSPEKKIAAAFVVGGIILSLCAFGFQNCSWVFGRFGDFLSFCRTPRGFALSAFVTLGLLIVVAIFWTWKQLTSHFSYVQIGSVIALGGLSLGLWTGGSLYYQVWIPQTQLIAMGVASAVLLIVGIKIGAVEESHSRNQAGTSAASSRDTIYGDARTALPDEINKVARGQAGGFEILFKD